MKYLIRFHPWYFLFFILLLAVEIYIGFYMHDAVIRPYGGDFLVVILLYCFVKSFLNTPVAGTALAVLLFSYIIETLQYFRLADRLGFRGPSVARTLLGSYFAWNDILCYTLGILAVLAVERVLAKR